MREVVEKGEWMTGVEREVVTLAHVRVKFIFVFPTIPRY